MVRRRRRTACRWRPRSRPAAAAMPSPARGAYRRARPAARAHARAVPAPGRRLPAGDLRVQPGRRRRLLAQFRVAAGQPPQRAGPVGAGPRVGVGVAPQDAYQWPVDVDDRAPPGRPQQQVPLGTVGRSVLGDQPDAAAGRVGRQGVLARDEARPAQADPVRGQVRDGQSRRPARRGYAARRTRSRRRRWRTGSPAGTGSRQPDWSACSAPRCRRRRRTRPARSRRRRGCPCCGPRPARAGASSPAPGRAARRRGRAPSRAGCRRTR